MLLMILKVIFQKIKEPIILFRGVGGRVRGSFIYENLAFINEYSYMSTWNLYMKVDSFDQLRPRIKKPRMKLIKRGSRIKNNYKCSSNNSS